MTVGDVSTVVIPLLISEVTPTVLAKIVLGSIDDSGRILV